MAASRGMGRGARAATFLAVAALAVALDQLTKALVRASLPIGRPVPFVSGLVEFLHVENTGAAFSLGEGSGWVFVLVAVVAAASSFVWKEDRLPAVLVVSLGCVAGGGIGNLVDRVAQGSVTDFLATTFVDFPVFNVADIFVTCGIAVSFVAFLVWDASLGDDARDGGREDG